ncbi:MAG: hypothetical protein NDI94_04680, partial [Candidatus Woesearchaeota archaeon]|nr:hypothetical protein [Candidatus Woesearchaeota archaeon]
MSLVNLVRQFKEKYNFTQPDIRQFKELEGLNLTQLIVRLYSDFSDKGIHRSFGDNLKHGMFYAAGEELKKLPFEITGAINAFLGLFGPIPELNNYNRPIYRDGNLESIATNAGLYANIKSNGKQKDANELPLEVTCDLKQYREWHILYTYAEAMEFAEELSKIGRNDLADRMVRELDSYADPNVDYHMSDLNNLLLEIGHEIREYIDENDWKTLMTLANIQESEDAFKHTFTKKTTRPIENRMKRNGVDNAYSEGFTDSVRSYLRSFSGKHPWRYVAIAGAVIGLGAAIAVGYGTRQAIFSYLQRQDKNREYAVAELLPEASNELSGALPYSISV